jgi:hypothetical protein
VAAWGWPARFGGGGGGGGGGVLGARLAGDPGAAEVFILLVSFSF